MKYLLMAIFLFCFVATPLYLLDQFVMPELEALQQTYAHAGDIADRIADGASAH